MEGQNHPGIPLPEFSRPADASADGLVVDKKIHGYSSVVLPLLAPGDRVWLATYRDTVGRLPVLSLGPRCCRNSACAQLPCVETSESIASAPLCCPFPAKCAHHDCLISRVQSSKSRSIAVGCDDRGKHSTIKKLS